ncbi:hypothetical protein MPH_02011 [Macrophomina phaseolina MS6]|uniref:YMC020W-like alpha/beta hydrolase domain-containing protein n=1 Tax=Macrophomina phaseolina (strain MS6) TaxID=1126212 RepID=K2RDQ5_MACPH|nr:hypothetical protein MPH_02011 [Macrophomina phaseolina MS6]
MPEDSKRRLPLLDRLTDRVSMGPRKKPKPSPQASTKDSRHAQHSSPPDAPPTTSDPQHEDAPSASMNASATSIEQRDGSATGSEPRSPVPPKGVAPRSSWYTGGSWRAKAAPIAQVARESISSAAGGVTSDSSSDVNKQDSAPNTPIKFLDRRTSSKSTALAASTTNVIATSSIANDSKASLVPEAKEEQKTTEVEPPLPPDPVRENGKPSATTTEHVEATPEQKEFKTSSYIPSLPRGWYGWWSRPDGYANTDGDGKGADKDKNVDIEGARSTPLPGTTPTEEGSDPTAERGQAHEPQSGPDPSQALQNEVPSEDSAGEKATPTRSWFWLWSNTQNVKQTANIMEGTPHEPGALPRDEGEQQELSQQDQVEAPASEETKPPTQALPKKSTGWAFWSRANQKEGDESDAGSTHKQVGELAVADTPSQSHPEAAQFNEHQEEQPKEPVRSIRGSIRRGRGKASDAPSKPSNPVKATPDHSPTRKAAEEATTKQSPKDTTKAQQPQKQQTHDNLLLPEFKSTYRMAHTPSYWEKVRKYLLGGHEPESPHLQRANEPLRIKKALAIGVHGYFPAPILQKVLGQPTGTSIRFANAAAAAIKNWTESQGYSCETEKVALEGEGFVSDRVDTLWKLLINWIEHIRTADFILVACHSQGVPVAIMLVAKLIQFGCVNAARIGVCAMAGVNLGPFPEYRSRFFGGSAGELFEFSRPDSLVSQKYQGSLRVVLNYGVRIVYVGSIDDQLVSLESSTFSNISHPYIYRAVFVDGRIHAPDLFVPPMAPLFSA